MEVLKIFSLTEKHKHLIRPEVATLKYVITNCCGKEILELLSICISYYIENIRLYHYIAYQSTFVIYEKMYIYIYICTNEF